MRRQLKRIGSALAATCLTLITLPAFAQDYHANDVTPAGSATAQLNSASGGKQAGSATLPISGLTHAVLVSGNALSVVDLHPSTATYYMSDASSSDDLQQCGSAYAYMGGNHAGLWSGSAASFVDLHPRGYNMSFCLGVHNGQQVGFAQTQSYFITSSHAMLWTGYAGTVVDLHVVTYPYTRATGVHDGEQVGYGSSLAYPTGNVSGYHTTSHALRWAGSAASAVDLSPVGYGASEALATNGLQQGGWGYLPGVVGVTTATVHALLWSGTADSVVDLHPAGYTDSRITSLTATQQVGEGWVGPAGVAGSVRHALLWNGTADTVVDLNQYLPVGYTHGVATGIDANGNVVGYAYNIAPNGSPADAIAVVFAPGPAPAVQLSSITLTPSGVAPGDVLQGQVSLGGAAPAGGVSINFLSTNEASLAAPAPLTIAEGDTIASFTVTAGSSMTVPTSLKLYATDGAVSKMTPATITPIVRVASVTANAVEGGFPTSGVVALSIPAQSGGATVTLTSGDTSLVAVPLSVFVPFGSTALSFPINTTTVSAVTLVPVTATFGSDTVSTTLSVNPAPVVAVASVTVPAVVGGQSVLGYLAVSNFPRGAAGAVVTLTSSDTTLVQVPATVTVPQNNFGVSFTATTFIVKSGIKTVTITASYNGTVVTGTVAVNPVPTVTISQADYMTDTQMLKVTAATSFDNSILTYGTDVSGGPMGTMQFELGMFKGSILLATAPKTVTVWNSNGGSATMGVTVRTPNTGGSATGGGGGGTAPGGGGTTATSFKISIAKTGKGTVTTNPIATSFAAGTVVTLTATPDAGQPWIGWSGACTGTSTTCTVTMSSNLSVTANFK